MMDVDRITELNTLALVVLYNPDAGAITRLERVLAQVSRLLVVDNTPLVDRNRTVWQWGASCESVVFLENAENIGLGAAYNLGFAEACRRRVSWVLVLDQDTELTNDYLSTVSERLDSVSYKDSKGRTVGVIGVNFVNSAVSLTQVGEVEAVLSVSAVISSGSLVSLAAWNASPRFDEGLFIDYVDIDFCMKIKSMGYGVVLIGDVLMKHSLGNPGENSLFGFHTRFTSNYPAFRHYYMSRNFLVIARRHGFVNKLWLFNEMKKRLKFDILSLLMEGNRPQMLLAISAGMFDGCRGHMGKRESHSVSRL